MKRILAMMGVAAGVAMAGSASAEDALKIGIIAPFSGNYAIFGEGYERGTEVWKDMYGEPAANGRKIEIVKIDTRCDVNTGLAAYRREAADLVATIGPACSGVVKAATPLIEKDKRPSLFLGHGASLTLGKKDGYLFRMTQPDELNLRVFGDFIITRWKELGYTKIAVIHDTTVTFGKTGEVMKASAQDQGVDLVAVETFDLGNKDFTGQLLNVKNSGAQAVVVVTYAADEGRLMRQMAELNLGIPVAGGVDTPYLATIETELVEGQTKILEDLFFYSDYVWGEDASEMKKFDQAFEKRYNLPPLDINYEGWLALSLLQKALEQPGAAEGGEKLRAALQNVKLDLGGRTVSFVENGDQATLLTYIGQIKNGRPELVKLITRPRKDYSLTQ